MAEIREASKNDFDVIMDLLIKLKKEVDSIFLLNVENNIPYYKKLLEHALNSFNHIWLIAYVKEKPVGIVEGLISSEVAFKNTKGKIRNLYVLKEYRRKGIGSALVKSLEKVLRRKNAGFLELQIYPSDSKQFYEKLGYKVDVLVMRK